MAIGPRRKGVQDNIAGVQPRQLSLSTSESPVHRAVRYLGRYN